MSTLRERVKAALLDEVEAAYPSHFANEAIAESMTAAVFDAMGDARPCARCGKSIGPAKVARGYVLCYSCGRP